MVFCRSTFVLIGLVIALAMSQGTEALRGAKHNQEKQATEFHLAPANFEGCIQAKGKGMNSEVILGTDAPFCTKLTIDNDGLIHAADTNLCLQAGHGHILNDGSKLRLYNCNRFSIFQKFAWSGTPEGRLKLKVISHDDLCVTFQGIKADIGQDPIIFKKCSAVLATQLKWKEVAITEAALTL